MTVDIYETINNNIYNFPKKLPYITVSAKGISNGLSTIYNDGADFGPDTYLNASSKNRYGPPYTQTSGIQEAFNYLQQFNGGEIKLTSGLFYLNNTAIFTSQGALKISGIHPNFVRGDPNFPLISNGTIIMPGPNFPTNNLPLLEFLNVSSSANNGYVDIGNLGIIGLYLIEGQEIPDGPSANSPIGLQFGNTTSLEGNGPVYKYVHDIKFIDCVSAIISYNGGGATYYDRIGMNACGMYNANTGNYSSMELYESCQMGIVGTFAPGGPHIIKINNVAGGYSPFVLIDQLNTNFAGNDIIGFNVSVNNPYTQIQIGKINAFGYPNNGSSIIGIYNTGNLVFQIGQINQYGSALLRSYYSGTAGLIYGHVSSWYGTNQPQLVINEGTVVSESQLVIDSLYLNGSWASNYTPSNFLIGNLNMIVKQANIQIPTPVTTNGTTAGTVSIYTANQSAGYTKYIITLSGYENDTTTNQTINFPIPFTTSAAISANNTSLIISTTTTGITITSPNSTTTYSGIVIVEGY